MYHTPIGGLLHDSAGGAADAALALDECQLEHYRKHGYVAGVRVLDEYQVRIAKHGVVFDGGGRE